jgi:hypothetical protein
VGPDHRQTGHYVAWRFVPVAWWDGFICTATVHLVDSDLISIAQLSVIAAIADRLAHGVVIGKYQWTAAFASLLTLVPSYRHRRKPSGIDRRRVSSRLLPQALACGETAMRGLAAIAIVSRWMWRERRDDASRIVRHRIARGHRISYHQPAEASALHAPGKA